MINIFTKHQIQKYRFVFECLEMIFEEPLRGYSSCTPKGIVIFYPQKSCGSLTHSISEKVGGKNSSVFFFSTRFFLFSPCFFSSSGIVYTALIPSKSMVRKKTSSEIIKNFDTLTRILLKIGQKPTFPGK